MLGSMLYRIRVLRDSRSQGPEHPSPGCPYTGTRRVAYLPYTKEGEDVLNLLKIAWDRRLLFSVGTSITTGRRDVVTYVFSHDCYASFSSVDVRSLLCLEGT